MKAYHDQLETLIHEENYRQMGQIAIDPQPAGGYVLSHWEDRNRLTDTAEIFDHPESALQIGLRDDAEEYRPLKTAPNLRHGWILRVRDGAALRQALDLFYPGLVGAYLAYRRGQLGRTPMLGTMGRQTGMYQRVRAMTAEQGDELCGNICSSNGGCLRTILWDVEPGYGKPRSQPGNKFNPGVNQTGSRERAIPLLCFEICNIFVAKARSYLKSQDSPVAG